MGKVTKEKEGKQATLYTGEIEVPSIKCPSCHYRNSDRIQNCINCGEPLMASQEEPARPTIVEPIPPAIPEQRELQAEPAQQAAPVDPAVSQMSLVPVSQAPQTRGESTALVARGNQLPGQPNPAAALDIYQAQTGLINYQIPGLTPIEPEDKWESMPRPWETDKLPFGFPKRKADVSGIIIHTQSDQEYPDYPNFLWAITGMLSELIWIASNTSYQQKDERMLVTTLRIEIGPGTIKDVRIMGNMRGANLTLGDAISVWGTKRHGILKIRKGYNHTTKAVITTNIMSMIIPAVIVVGLTIGLIFVVAFYSQVQAALQAFLHTISTYIHR